MEIIDNTIIDNMINNISKLFYLIGFILLSPLQIIILIDQLVLWVIEYYQYNPVYYLFISIKSIIKFIGFIVKSFINGLTDALDIKTQILTCDQLFIIPIILFISLLLSPLFIDDPTIKKTI